MTTVYRLNKDFASKQPELDLSSLRQMKVGESIIIPLSIIQYYKRPQKSLKKRVHQMADSLGVVFLVYPLRQQGFKVLRTR